MANQFLITLLFKGFDDIIEFEVREYDWQRVQKHFDQIDSSWIPGRCLVFDTVDGLTVALSISDIQLVHFPRNVVPFASDQIRKEDDVRIWLRGRVRPVCFSAGEEKDALFAFFTNLDTDAENEAFPEIIDIDGELRRFNAAEIVMATAPAHEVKQGHRDLLRDVKFDDDASNGIPF